MTLRGGTFVRMPELAVTCDCAMRLVRHVATPLVRLGKRQVEGLAGLAAMDFEDFYENRRPASSKRGDLLVLSCDGKGIVMRPDALRTRAPARPRAGPAPKPRLSGEEQQNRKRMAEIGAV